jgi:hypothetical protein
LILIIPGFPEIWSGKGLLNFLQSPIPTIHGSRGCGLAARSWINKRLKIPMLEAANADVEQGWPPFLFPFFTKMDGKACEEIPSWVRSFLDIFWQKSGYKETLGKGRLAIRQNPIELDKIEEEGKRILNIYYIF